MKSLFLSAIALAASASATITVITPWADTTWTSGGHGNITWNADAADSAKDCHIQLMNGNATNSNMVAYVTAPTTPVKCSTKSYDIYPLNDFAPGDYWIRVGQTEGAGNWGYSGVFKFKGNGTARPYQLASGASNSAPAAAATGGKSAGTKASGTSDASQAAQSDESAAMHLNVQGKTLAAVAGGAIAAAVALAM